MGYVRNILRFFKDHIPSTPGWLFVHTLWMTGLPLRKLNEVAIIQKPDNLLSQYFGSVN